MSTPLFEHEIDCEGRGPELRSFLMSSSGASIRGIEFEDEQGLKRIEFQQPQVIQITPEEVADSYWVDGSPAHVLDLGKSTWLRSFRPTHLERCHHFRLILYDQVIDVVCEGLELKVPPF